MKTPDKKRGVRPSEMKVNKPGHNVVQLAATTPKGRNEILIATDLVTKAYNDDPFATPAEVKQRVCQVLVDDLGISDIRAVQLYTGATNSMIPFLSSGEKIVQADAQLDNLMKIASKELYRTLYDRNGNAISEEFNFKVMDSITKAQKVKLDTLMKAQSNIILAQKQNHQEDKDFDLSSMERDQLERFVAGELVEHPDLVDNIIGRLEDKSNVIDIGFVDEISEE